MKSLLPRLPIGLLVVAMIAVMSLLVLPQTTVRAAAFAQGNIVVYRVGDGSTITGADAAAVFLDEFTTAGGTAVQSIALPTTDNGVNKQLVARRDASDEGLLTRSADGQYLLLTGYDTDLGTTAPDTADPSVIARVIGRVDSSGTIDTSTLLTDTGLSGVTGSPRSAASTNGTDLFFGGNRGGVRYTTLGSTGTSTTITTPAGQSLRQLNIFDNQLYATTNTDPVAIGTVGTGTPTTSGQTITALPGISSGMAGTTNEAYGFFFANLDGTPGLDTLYIADDGNDAIQKFSLVGGTWTLNGSIALTTPIPANPSVRGLIGTVTGTSVTLYGTTTTRLYSVTDATGFNQIPTGTISVLATNTVTNSAFRGLAFAPVALVVPTATSTTTGTATATATATATGTATATTTATVTATSTGTVTATPTGTTTAIPTVTTTPTATGVPSSPFRIYLPLILK